MNEMKILFICYEDGELYECIYYDFETGGYVCWKHLTGTQKKFHKNLTMSLATQERLAQEAQDESRRKSPPYKGRIDW
jgi:recombinational DNA repair protein (RecF pathway)